MVSPVSGPSLLEDILATLPNGEIVEVCIGQHWTAVTAEVDGHRRCGLSATFKGLDEGDKGNVHTDSFLSASGQSLAELALKRDQPILASVGVAALNALLPSPRLEDCMEGNAESILEAHGVGKRVAIVGHFPFITRLRSRIEDLVVLDRRPRKGDLPAEAAPQVLPNSEIVAITGMAVTNHTLEDLLKFCPPEAVVMILGPSTPFSPVLFEYGVDLLSGSLVTAIEPVIRVIRQGGNISQINRGYIRQLTVSRPGFADLR